MACLVRSFMETSCNPHFRHSLYHEMLFKYHVQDDKSIPDPGCPPFYDKAFFNTIRHYHVNSPLNISVLTTRQWYRLLMEDNVLFSPATESSPPSLIPIKVESLNPTNDWSSTWRIMRLKGMEAVHISFLFKMIHNILPTEERLKRLNKGNGICNLCGRDSGNLTHSFFFCPWSCSGGLTVLGLVQKQIPSLQQEQLLVLDIPGDLSPSQELSVVCITAVGLMYVWETRVARKKVEAYKVRAELEAQITLLRETRYYEAGNLINDMLNT